MTVTSDTEPGGESVTLVETSATSAVFRGTIAVKSGAIAQDGVLQVEGGDTIVATYIDADDGLGHTNVTKTDTALVDCTAPAISNVRETAIGLTTATIAWSTDEASDSVVFYGEAIPPVIEKRGNAGTTDHRVDLSGLASCTVYYYEVRSQDPQGNAGSDDNGGVYHRFETYGDFGSGPVSCHAGEVVFGDSAYGCSTSATIRLSDLDLNGDALAVDQVLVAVTSTTEATPELVILTETGANTSTFTGAIATSSGAVHADGAIQVVHGDVITVTYSDGDDGTGAPGMSFDTAVADCAAPVVSDVRVDSLTDQRATIRWNTLEPSQTILHWGNTPVLGNTVSDATLKTSHAVSINRFSICQEAFFRIESADRHGYHAQSDEGGAPFSFAAFDIPGLYWRDHFESGNNGWQLGGEWQIGSPQGRGGSSGSPDPSSAYNNAGVLGHDLTGLGAHPGDYEPNSSESAFTPFLNATTWDNTKLIYFRQLHSGPNDDALVNVWIGPGYTVYRSNRELVNDSSYGYTSFDLAGLVDGKPQVRVEFRQTASMDGNYSGWTIDDVILKDGSKPDYDACMTCGAAPSFQGAIAAIDNDACGATGVTVSWDSVTSWGTGKTGSYAVYRGESPGFIAGPASLIASGLEGLTYTDVGAPTDRTSYYLVRAESNETCGTGPHNGGRLDDNARYVRADETTSRPTPGAVNGLDVALLGRAHVRLTWPGAAHASRYRILRSISPSPGTFVTLAETADTRFDDLSAGAGGQTYFYTVVALDACGNAGP
ncbi:MAG: hypothetical protein HC882_03345 [Acidobacteria bacterium]|nr:hypothetical protein [Acidobacteriota bacterium]